MRCAASGFLALGFAPHVNEWYWEKSVPGALSVVTVGELLAQATSIRGTSKTARRFIGMHLLLRMR
jgi:hypothetical protein